MPRFALALCSALCAAPVYAVVVNHQDVAAVGSIPQSVIDAGTLGQTWFLSHASIGENMSWGVDELHLKDPLRYPLVLTEALDTPPATVAAGRFYEYYRGNTGYEHKVDSFKQFLENGWGAGATVAINKLCYLDPDADWQYYAVANANGSALAQLEAVYPGITFIYCTIPVFNGEHNPEIVATLKPIQAFNDNLRSWTQANGKILFDMADILSHDPEGNPLTVMVEGVACESMYEGYANTDDYRHLNGAGYENLALGLYALTPALTPEPGQILLAVGALVLMGLRPRVRAR